MKALALCLLLLTSTAMGEPLEKWIPALPTTPFDPMLGKWVFVVVNADGTTLSSPVVNLNIHTKGVGVYELTSDLRQPVECYFEDGGYECYSDYPPPFEEFYLDPLHKGQRAHGRTEDGLPILGFRVNTR